MLDCNEDREGTRCASMGDTRMRYGGVLRDGHKKQLTPLR